MGGALLQSLINTKVMAVLASFAEFYVYSRLIVPSTIEQKARALQGRDKP
jgi:hypothetical protein